MRVLHLRNTSGYFGAERCIVAWIHTLAARGHRFDVAAFDHPDPSSAEFYRAAERAGADLHVLPRGHERLAGVTCRLVELVRERKIDVLHAHENRSHVVAWAVGRWTGTPVVATVHGYIGSSAKMARLNALDRRLLARGRFAAVTTPTRLLQRALGDRAEFVPNAAPEELARTPLVANARGVRPIVGVVARLSREKGVDVFLDAVAALPDGVALEVIGEGPLAEGLRAHPAAARVRWLGYRADAAHHMRGWAVLVLPSRTEGLPLVLLEAMAQGVPIVATSVGGVPDAVTDGVDARLVPPEDPTALVRAIAAVLSDPDGARKRAEAGRARFLATYTLARVADRLEALYVRATGGAA